jgi:putative Mg2+ transporter-C (MgtC) family protein
MTISIQQAAIDLAVAGGLSALIGFERQWRNRHAGLRTNTLVALGSASFVIFEALVPGDASPTRVAAQVVSGIGFLGAGLIFREGLSVRGLNTAATIWCSAAIGVLAGAGVSSLCGAGNGICPVRQSVAATDRDVHQPAAFDGRRGRGRLSRIGHVP